MHPGHSRPRPPANQRAPSARFTALPTPLSPRRQRPSALSTSSNSSPAPDLASSYRSPIWSSSVPPDTPPLGMDEALDKQLGEGDNKLKDERESTSRTSDPTSTIPFPPRSSRSRLSDVSTDSDGVELGEVSTPTRHSFAVPDDGSSRSPELVKPAGVEEKQKGLSLDPAMFGAMSRGELEKMLSEADRIIREKEEELSVFTSAGEGLLQEYHSLRNRHDSLLSRQRSTSGLSASPLRPSRLSSVSLSPSHARLPSDSGSQRGWRNSLGAASGAAGQHRRVSSGRVGITSSSSYVFASSSSSTSLSSANTTPPQTIRIEMTGAHSPNTSPTALRSNRFTSSTSVASLFAPPPRTMFSPKSSGSGVIDAHEVENLSHLNYTLTQRVEELEAETEFTEKEGRKKLRRLEKELLALKEDLERSEGRNAMLEMEKEVEKKGKSDLGRDWDENLSESEDGGSRRSSSSRTSLADPEEPELDLGEVSTDTIHPPSASPPSSRFLTTSPGLSSLRSPGNGVSRLRAVSSTSSLAPLPRPSPFDPSLLDAQQDELLNQLIAKIDELQEANEAILEEREDMEERLEIAREEVREWMGKCEELEGQGRIEWDRADRPQIGWLENAPETPSSSERRPRFEPTAMPGSREGSPTPPSSAIPDLGRSLRNELSGLWSRDTSTSQDPDTVDETDEGEEDYEAETVGGSIVVHQIDVSNPTSPNLAIPRIRRRNPRRTITPISFSQRSTSTAHDLVPSGSLGKGSFGSKGYEDFAKRAEKLEPAWADETTTSRPLIEGSSLGQHRMLEIASSNEEVIGGEEEDTRQLRSKKEKPNKKLRGKKNRHLVLSSIRFGSDEEGETLMEDPSTPRSRRNLALRRLGLEASSRHTSRMFPQPQPQQQEHEQDQVTTYAASDRGDDDDATSVVSSNYDLLDQRDNLASNDYYPLTLRARYHPKMLSNMMRDSAVRHVVTLITWVRFLVVLAIALSFAVWQGPRKTLGLVDGRRRLR